MLMLIILSFMMLMFLSLTSLFLMNSGVSLITLKVFSHGFYGDLEILFSVWSFLLLIMVLFIGTSVLFSSYSYSSVTSVNNFLSIYLSFILSMTWLILNNNFYRMMFGWDGLGVTSSSPIVYYMNNESINNGLFTVFQNRLGDVFFVVFLVSVTNLSIQSSLYIPLSMVFLALGASVKSAQYPFNMWLLAAMSAPTPISALVHSSTLVVAGVYILLQYSYCLGSWLSVLKCLSGLTLAMSFFGLVNEKDMKKLIAYPTMSHVALMVYLYSLQLYKIVYFHLNVHAMFKPLMFMSFGFVMLSSQHSQDSRLVSVYSVNPSIKMFYYYSCLCLMGLPFLSAFFSKDFILEKTVEVEGELSSVLLLMLFLSVSVFYSMKLLFLYNVMFVYLAIEKQYLGSISLLMMILISSTLINLFISSVFSISLEFVSFKMMIYLYLLSFMVLVSLVKWNYKLPSFSKSSFSKELWSVSWYSLDLYVYWTFNLVLNYTNKLMEVKLLLMVNWWVLVGVLYVF